ncbi:MAG: FTR1 family iron permease [Oscillospiraceae bacterium]|jgi:high-affinity iron transporter|nr:FTR1 family iron permease [Oscillospiraceae bacterium]
MRKILAFTALVLVVAAMFSAPALAAEESYATWNEIVDAMEDVANEAYRLYAVGESDAAKEQVNVAYYGFYEKLGFEKTVMAYISGSRATKVEYQFSAAKKAITDGADKSEVKATLDTLISLLREDANQLDGSNESSSSVFIASLLIIVREGAEAIIIVGAIIAYLMKSGNKSKVRSVYIGSVAALGASVIMALILNALAGAATGASQEVIEGATMLLAVVVLFYVSNWMVGKAESETWSRYIEGKVEGSITKNSTFALAFTAFLAVFREGAEVILFYQALLAGTESYTNMVWAGLYVGIVILVVIYLLIRLLSITLPLKPFFLGTSVLMFVMSISFVGSGIKELQEGNVVSVTPVSGISSVELLGIYPTVETLIPQLVLLLITIATFVIQVRRWKKAREKVAQ